MNFLIQGALLGSLLILSPSVFSKTPDIEKGRRLFMANCLQCHNRDPNVRGSIGPEVIDAPLEVMTSKIMTGKYPDKLPEGFEPKRKTRAMRPIPKLKNDIPDIWAFVQSVKKKK